MSDAYGALRIPEFRYILLTRLCITLAVQIQYVAIGWQIYSLTGDKLALGLTGLAEALPYIVVSLFSGYVADTYNRKYVYQFALMLQFIGSVVLAFIGMQDSHTILQHGLLPFYVVIGIVGFARGFMGPSLGALWGEIVPRELYANAATWNANTYNAGSITGPALGGLLMGFAGEKVSYMVVCGLVVLAFILIMFVRSRPVQPHAKGESLGTKLTAGLRFVFGNQVLIGAMALDMFAVLFGGAVAMLPAIAKDVLHVGPEGMGLLRAATAIGSIAMGLVVAFHPPVKNTGYKLLLCVAGFGACMIGFAYSEYYWLSFVLLAASGAFDNVSMVIRGSIAQLLTPDSMRGRVSAVNGIFIGSSNEIGAFESGVAARYLGLQPSIVFGGIMTLVVVATTWLIAPTLRTFHIQQSHQE
ncbi:MAG: MFS transporter [Candidatus Kapabacteria bacterium]|nr:MFS transporter [Candidatus Kapabacteria bacterium]